MLVGDGSNDDICDCDVRAHAGTSTAGTNARKMIPFVQLRMVHGSKVPSVVASVVGRPELVEPHREVRSTM